MAEQQTQLVDPTEFDNMPIQEKEEAVEKNVNQKTDTTEQVDNRGVDLAVPPEEDSKIKSDKNVKYVADEATVTKRILRPSSKYYTDHREQQYTGSDFFTAKTPKGIIAGEDKKAGLYTTEMLNQAEISVAEQNRPFTANDLETLIQNNATASSIPELTPDEWEGTKTAHAILNDTSGIYEDIDKEQAKEIINNSLTTVNGARQTNAEYKIPFARGETFAPTEKAVTMAEQESDFALWDKQKVYFEGRKELYRLVKNIGMKDKDLTSDDRLLVHTILMDKITTGEFWDNAIETGNEIVRGISDIPPLIGSIVASATTSLFKGRDDHPTLGYWGAVVKNWDTDEKFREELVESWRSAIGGTDTFYLSNNINSVIHSELKKMLDNRKIDQDTYDRITSVKEVVPAVGNQPATTEIRKRGIVNDGEAATFLNESLSQLSGLKQFLLIALENSGGIYSISKIRIRNYQKNLTNFETKINKVKAEQWKAGEFKFAGMGTLEAARVMRKDGLIGDFNEKMLQTAIGMNVAEKQFNHMTAGLKNMSQELTDLKTGLSRQGKDYTKNIEYIKLKNDYSSLRGKVIRNIAFRRTKPIFNESLKIALPASLTQMAAVQAFHNWGDADFYTAQAVGSMIHLAGLIKFNPKKWFTGEAGLRLGDIPTMPARWAISQTGNLKDAMLDWTIVSKLTDDIFRSKDLKELDNIVKASRNGRGLTFKEKRGAEYLFQLASVLPRDRAEQVLSGLKDHIRLEDDVIAMFPKQEQELISRLVKAPFAQSSGMVWLQSAYSMTGHGIHLGDLKSLEKMEDLMQIKEAAKLENELLARAISELKFKVGGRTDIADPRLIEKLVNKYQKMYDLNTEKLADDTKKLNDNMKQVLEHLYVDQDKTINKDVLDTLWRGRIEAKIEIGEASDEASAAEQVANEIYGHLKTKAKVINEKYISDAVKSDANNLLLEQIFDNHINSFYARGRAKYSPLDKELMKNKKYVDVSDLMWELKEVQDPLNSTDFKAFFSKESDFYNSSLNKRLHAALDRMARRTLRATFPKTLNKLMDMASNPKSKHYIDKRENLDYMDIALYWQEKGKLKPFKALFSEVQDLYTAFRDYGFRLDAAGFKRKGQTDTFANMFKNKASSIDKLIQESVPNFHARWKEANLEYKKEVYDRIDGDGILNKYFKSKTGRVTETTKEGTNILWSNVYKSGTPSELIQTLVPKLEKYLAKSGTATDRDNFKNEFSEFYRQFSEFGTGENSKVHLFNLDTPQGKDKWDAFKNALETHFGDRWGRKFIELYSDIDKAPRIQFAKGSGSVIKLTQGGGYDFSRLDINKLKELQDVTKVKVLENGKIKEMPLINFTNLIEEQKDIVRHLEKYPKAQRNYTLVKDRIGDKMKSLQTKEATILSKRRNDVLEQIYNITGYKGKPENWYRDYVVNGSLEGYLGLKNLVTKGLDPAFKGKISISDKEWDEAIKYLFIKGIMGRGNLTPASGKALKNFRGDSSPVYGIEEPDLLFADITDKNMRPIFNEILGEEHTQFLENTINLIKKEQESLQDLDSITGVVRPISTNEIISRAFNLARGMVSPTYVAAEIAVRLASNAGIELLQLAGGNKDAARLMKKMIEYPEKLSGVELKKFQTLVIDFVATEFLRSGEDFDFLVPDWVEKILGKEKEKN